MPHSFSPVFVQTRRFHFLSLDLLHHPTPMVKIVVYRSFGLFLCHISVFRSLFTNVKHAYRALMDYQATFLFISPA